MTERVSSHGISLHPVCIPHWALRGRHSRRPGSRASFQVRGEFSCLWPGGGFLSLPWFQQPKLSHWGEKEAGRYGTNQFVPTLFFFCGYISNYFSIVTVQKFLICELRQRLEPLRVFTEKASCHQKHRTVKNHRHHFIILYIFDSSSHVTVCISFFKPHFAFIDPKGVSIYQPH